VTPAIGDPHAHQRLLDVLGHPSGVLVAAFVEAGCEACRPLRQALTEVGRYPDVSTRTIEVGTDSSLPEEVGLAELPALLVLEGGLERLRRVGHHDETALVSSIRHSLEDVPPSYEHRAP
jgi:hypothetical protein